jgi:hypothetical protein
VVGCGKLERPDHHLLIRPSINAAGLHHIDSGNSWRSAISEDFFPLPGLYGTGHKSKWDFHPIIVRKLAMDCNLSGSYLMRNKWDHLYSRHALLIQGAEVPLVQAPAPQTAVSAVYTTNASTIPPNSGQYVTLIAPDVRKGFQNDGEMYLRGDHSFMDRLDVHPSLNAIINCNRDGQTYGAIINKLGIPLDIPKGTRFGTVTSTCPDNELGHTLDAWRPLDRLRT